MSFSCKSKMLIVNCSRHQTHKLGMLPELYLHSWWLPDSHPRYTVTPPQNATTISKGTVYRLLNKCVCAHLISVCVQCVCVCVCVYASACVHTYVSFVSMFILFFISSRYQKEQVCNHFSPVKKRVKENTPPGEEPTSTTGWVTMGSASSQLSSHHSSCKHRTGCVCESIVIADSPSPISVITISSDSEEDDTQKSNSPNRSVTPSVLCFGLLMSYSQFEI